MTSLPLPPTPGRLRALFDAAGARWIDVPVLHPADPFLETAGEDIRRRMFVTEGPTGERLALRPDFTIPVCLAHLAAGRGPERYAYEGVVFRRHDAGSPERLEAGYEDIGRAERTDADTEALRLAVDGVGLIAPGSPGVRLGDIGFFAALLAALKLPGRWRRRLRRSFGAPAVMAANLERLAAPRGAQNGRFDPELRDVIAAGERAALIALLAQRAADVGHGDGFGRSPEEIADRFLDQRALPDPRLAASAAAAIAAFLRIEAELDLVAPAVEAFATERGLDFGSSLTQFVERARAIAQCVPARAMRFEAGFGRPLDYYTGLVFEVRAAGFPYPLAGGGRYDRLMEMLGAAAPIPAVGFTIRLDAWGGRHVG